MSEDVNVVVPQLGNEIEEAQVDLWLKQVGDAVAKGEQIVVVSTPKVTIEIEAPASGHVKAVLAEAQSIVVVGSVLAVIETD
jgi:pyruvate/2-oxoglutarate dehydrogenase complex dihydrolipoamide acyltransferase (E2) component